MLDLPAIQATFIRGNLTVLPKCICTNRRSIIPEVRWVLLDTGVTLMGQSEKNAQQRLDALIAAQCDALKEPAAVKLAGGCKFA